MNYHIVEREAFQVVGVKQEFACGPAGYRDPGVPEFWENAEKKGTVDQLIPLINGEIKGLLGITENYDQKTVQSITGLLQNIGGMYQMSFRALSIQLQNGWFLK